MNNGVVKVPKIKYLYSVIVSVLYVIIIAVFADKFDMKSSVIPFVIMAVYDIINVILVKNASPRECFKLFLTSVLTVFVLYKVVSVFGIVNTYNDDGFFSDTESNFYFLFDAMMVINMVSTFIFLVFLRFMMLRRSIKTISKTSLKRFAVCVTVLCIISVGDLLLWNFAEPYENEFLDYVSTYSYEKWVNYPNKRITMFPDFEKNHGIKGMEQSKVEEFIGKPETEYGYEMGYDKNGHNILVITYKDGIVQEYKIIQLKQNNE